jgi:site-specific DNA-methyltransferase (adenine-specific)
MDENIKLIDQDNNSGTVASYVPFSTVVNTIITGDAEAKLQTLESETVHLVFTSPPYNVGVEYDVYQDKLELNNYLEKLNKIFTECIRVLVPGGHLLINIANTGKQPYTPISDFISTMLYGKIDMRGEIIWNKRNSTNQTAWGSWLSANKPSLRDQHEYILVFRKSGDRVGDSDITNNEFVEYTKSIWEVTPETRDVNHPAPFPKSLVARAIKLYSFKGETVLDPFNGSGTTCEVAKKLGRNFIGIDISKRYCNLAEDRLNILI